MIPRRHASISAHPEDDLNKISDLGAPRAKTHNVRIAPRPGSERTFPGVVDHTPAQCCEAADSGRRTARPCCPQPRALSSRKSAEDAPMPEKTWDKSRLPSRHVTEGPDRAPHRSYYHAMGMTEEQIHRPLVGV